MLGNQYTSVKYSGLGQLRWHPTHMTEPIVINHGTGSRRLVYRGTADRRPGPASLRVSLSLTPNWRTMAATLTPGQPKTWARPP